MPEGDTIFRTAETLRATLVGRRIIAARSQPRPGLRRPPDLTRLVGATVASVESRGKHLLIGFDDGHTLRTHMRMRGEWHRYRKGEAWRRSPSMASAVLETADAVAVCFDAPVVELLTEVGLVRQPSLRALGPDLLAAEFDADEAVRRLRERDRIEIGEALLDQRAVAGIGNVYKSEVCFLEGADPWRAVGELHEAALRRLLATARRLLLAHAGGGRRVTTGDLVRGGGLWVYRRSGRPCRRCGTLIQSRRQGALARVTYWCPRCQR